MQTNQLKQKIHAQTTLQIT